jgi:hypothetical protein
MQRKSTVVAVALAMLVSGLWLSVGTRADEEAAQALPKAELLPTLEVKIKSLSGGNFSSYSVPSVDSTGRIDFKALCNATDNSETIRFLEPEAVDPNGPDRMGFWYIPVPGPMHVDGVENKYGRQQVRLIGEGLEGSRLRIELDYFKDVPDSARVWIIHEYRGFIDSVAFGEAKVEGPILADQASE